jgi:hypothetical protein
LREERSLLAYHNWRQPLPRPIVLPDVPLELATLADVRTFVSRHLPPEYGAKDTWQRVASLTSVAARGQLKRFPSPCAWCCSSKAFDASHEQRPVVQTAAKKQKDCRT